MANRKHSITRQDIRNIQNIEADWGDMLPSELYKSMEGYANLKMVPMDLVFLPMVTLSASLMGHSCCKVDDLGYTQPAILWTIAVQPKGSRKSAALNPMIEIMQDLQEKMKSECLLNGSFDLFNVTKTADQQQDMMIDDFFLANASFTLPRLHEMMMANNGNVCMVFDEIMRLYNTLERDGKDGEMRKVFLTLNGGDGWTVSTKTQGTTHIKETHLNYTGCMQPEALLSLLAKSDYDGFIDRHIILVPLDIIPDFEDRKAPPPGTIPLDEILNKLYEYHKDGPKEYTLTDAARNSYAEFYNELAARSREARKNDEDDMRGTLMKAQGQTARIAMVLQAMANTYTDDITTEIDTNIMRNAISFTRYLLKVKLSLLGDLNKEDAATPPISQRLEGEFDTTEPEDFFRQYRTYIAKIMNLSGTPITESKIESTRAMPPVKDSNGNKYGKKKADWVRSLERLQLGWVTMNRRGYLQFQRHAWDDLRDECKELLEGIGVTAGYVVAEPDVVRKRKIL